ncbi:YbfB/YjiJ family MFS transporter [Lentzea sp. NPDC055074]
MTVRAAAALAAAMGIGRFVYTPILPLMTAQAGLSATSAAGLATANYLGYFIGALATVVRAPSQLTNRVALVLLVATLAGMPMAHGMVAWFVLRLVAGVASALVFVAAVNARPGWGMSGIGVGIALSGLLALGWGQWQAAWWAAAGAAAVLAAGAWGLAPDPPEGSDLSNPPDQPVPAELSDQPAPADPPEPSGQANPPELSGRTDPTEVSDLPERIGVGARSPLGAGESGSIQDPHGSRSPAEPGANEGAPRPPSRRAFAVLFTAYTLEGVGYIIAATFLVAAISGPLGGGAWILVGVSAALSPVLVKPRRHALPAALAIQAIGIALPALVDGSALIATVLFGGTFIGIAATALRQGAGFPNSAAILTAGYSAGQIIGPLVATPLLHDGYDRALLLAAGIVALAAITALAPPSRRRAGARTRRRSRRAAPAE